MVRSILFAGLLGLATAAPATKTSKTTKMTSTTTAKGSGQTPFKFPLPNGFPSPASSALAAIESQAHGTLPDGALPSKLAAADVTAFQLIAFNEIFEVAFFTSLINNITSNSAGFGAPSIATATDVTANELVSILKAVQGQEQLHAIGANAVLTSAGQKAIKPCEYVFPSSTLTEAVRLASTFTDLVLGVLATAQYGLSENGDGELIPLVGTIIGQEGEQDGYYRSLLALDPSAQPFLTAAAPQFAYSILHQLFVVPGSCPNVDDIDLPVYPPLTLTTSTPIATKDQTLNFQFTNNGTNVNNLSIVFINGANTPVVEKLQNVKTQGKMVSFSASFQQQTNVDYGLTIAVLTSSNGPFASVSDVAADTVYGPALIEVQ